MDRMNDIYIHGHTQAKIYDIGEGKLGIYYGKCESIEGKDIYLTGKELEEIKTCTLEKLQLILKKYV